jgi:tetratricopeptide (TPR) repeat protein
MAGDATPTRREIEQQLERILKSKAFEETSTLGRLLRHLVVCELDGIQAEEYEIGIKVFGKPADWIPMHETAVRQSLANLRKRLAVYFEDEGDDDLVLIDFPKRGGYRPRYKYSLLSDAARRVARATSRLHQTFPNVEACGTIADELEACIREHPSYAPAYALLAEVLILGTLCDETYRFPARESIPRAEWAVAQCTQLNDQLWQAHVTAGALHCCRFAWEKAAKSFETALGLAPDETLAHFWYAAFLLAVGRTQEAKEAVSWRMKTMPQDRFTNVIRPLFLYVMREHKDAYDTLATQSSSYPAILMNPAYMTGDTLLEYDNWLVGLLLACLCRELGHTRAAWRYAEESSKQSGAGAFSGLVALIRCEEARLYPERAEQAQALLERLADEREWTSPLSFALAHIGQDRIDEAVEKLAEACEEGHPLMVWLHLWPVLGPLRKAEAFRRLLGRLGLPVQSA